MMIGAIIPKNKSKFHDLFEEQKFQIMCGIYNLNNFLYIGIFYVNSIFMQFPI